MAVEYVFDNCQTQSGSAALTRTPCVDPVESFRQTRDVFRAGAAMLRNLLRGLLKTDFREIIF